jgi:hypothetical protein
MREHVDAQASDEPAARRRRAGARGLGGAAAVNSHPQLFFLNCETQVALVVGKSKSSKQL